MLYKILLPIVALIALGFAFRHVVVADQEPPKLPPPVEPARSPFVNSVAGAGVIGVVVTAALAVGVWVVVRVLRTARRQREEGSAPRRPDLSGR